MSLIMLDGFDDNLRTLKWNVEDGTVNVVAGRFGNGVQMVGGAGENFLRRSLTAAEEHATVTIGVAVKIGAYETVLDRGELFSWLSDAAATTHVEIGVDTIGRVAAYRGSFGSGTQLGITTNPALQLNVWHYIECRVVLSDTVGVVQVWIDGALLIDLSNQDTKNAGTKTVFDTWEFHWNQSGLHQANHDDFYMTNGAGSSPYNGRLGDITVETLLPTGNGSTNQFIGSDGNSTDNYLLVDEATPDGDTTYVESAVNGDIDLYAFADLAATAATILGVVATVDGRHTGAADNARVLTRIGGVNYNGADAAMTSGYSAAPKAIWQTSPATAIDWTVAEVNGAQFGIENRP